MKSFSVATRITAIIALTLALLMALGAKSYLATSSIDSAFTEYRSTAKQSLLMNDMAEDLFEARMAAFKYRTSETDDAAAAVRSNVQEILDAKAEAVALLAGDDRAPALVEKIATDARDYNAAFDQMAGLQQTRHGLVEKVYGSGRAARKALSEIMESAYRDGDPEAAYYSGLAIQELLLARYYAKTYLLYNDESSYTTTLKHLDGAAADIVEMRKTLQNPARRALSEQAQQDFQSFRDAFVEVKSVITRRNQIRSDSLDTLGPKMQAEMEDILDGVVAHQRDIGAEAAETAASTLFTVAAISLVSLALGAVGGVYVARQISSDVGRMATVMQTLADGDLEVSIEGAEHAHELGRMARSLEVFKSNAEQVAELQQQRERQEAAAAAERAEMMEMLRQSFGAVVDAAVTGDFSKRIDAHFADAELNGLAEGVNTLVETVECGVGETSRVMSGVAGGDLKIRMEGDFQGAFHELQTHVNETVNRLDALVAQIASTSVSLNQGSTEISAGAGQLSASAEQQASSLEETAATMEEISASVKTNAEGSKSASALAKEASSSAGKGGEIVQAAVASMNEIEAGAAQIADIISVIDGIAFQTNLLALNAAVEAARAGDAGKGFAVVASEVRSLAQRSSEAARDIRSLIEASSNQVSKGVSLVQSAGGSLNEIVEAIRQVEQAVSDIAMASAEQSAGISEIAAAVADLDRITQRNASMAEESASKAKSLSSDADSLEQLIGFFSAQEAKAQRAAA